MYSKLQGFYINMFVSKLLQFSGILFNKKMWNPTFQEEILYWMLSAASNSGGFRITWLPLACTPCSLSYVNQPGKGLSNVSIIQSRLIFQMAQICATAIRLYVFHIFWTHLYFNFGSRQLGSKFSLVHFRVIFGHFWGLRGVPPAALWRNFALAIKCR